MPTPMPLPTLETTTEEVATLSLAEIEARLPGLALDAEKRRPGAAARLAAVEARHAELQSADRRAAWASQGRREHEVEQATQAETQRKTEGTARLEVYETVEIPALARKADAIFIDADRVLDQIKTLLDQADRLRVSLGISSRRAGTALALQSAVAWHLRAVLPAAARMAQPRLRLPLAELLAPAAKPPAPLASADAEPPA